MVGGLSFLGFDSSLVFVGFPGHPVLRINTACQSLLFKLNSQPQSISGRRAQSTREFRTRDSGYRSYRIEQAVPPSSWPPRGTWRASRHSSAVYVSGLPRHAGIKVLPPLVCTQVDYCSGIGHHVFLAVPNITPRRACLVF